MLTPEGHRRLNVWHLGLELAATIHSHTKAFPRDELYGLTSQLRRAAVSIPSNIAEGYGRGGLDHARFIDIAYGSLLELETQVELAQRFGYLTKADTEPLLAQTAELGRMLNGLRRSVRGQHRSSGDSIRVQEDAPTYGMSTPESAPDSPPVLPNPDAEPRS